MISFLHFSHWTGEKSLSLQNLPKKQKRFAGILELFSVLQTVCSRGKGLPVLQEASLEQPFIKIRSDIRKTAYASYWAELLNEWTEEDENQEELYYLFQYVLQELDIGNIPEATLSILFQMRFMALSGFYPNLTHCGICGIETEKMKKNSVSFDLARGELVCEKCVSEISSHRINISKGTIKQLLWVGNGDLKKSGRVRFSSQTLKEGLAFSEAFVPYHLGKTPRSLAFLRQIRK